MMILDTHLYLNIQLSLGSSEGKKIQLWDGKEQRRQTSKGYYYRSINLYLFL